MPYPVENAPCESLFVPALAQFCVSGTVRVVIRKAALNSFRRKALKHFPLEMFAHLIGRVNQPGGKIKEIEVTRMVFPPLRKSTGDSVEAEPMDVQLYSGESVVGTIHSHPWQADEPAQIQACPSNWDIRSAAAAGELVYCIYNIAEDPDRRRRRTHFGVFLGSPNVSVKIV